MASSGGVFSETLQTITTTKLKELSKKRKIFEDYKTSVLQATAAAPADLERLQVLLQGVKEAFQIKTDPQTQRVVQYSTSHRELEIQLSNLERFLQQARYDPSISKEQQKHWRRILNNYLEVQSRKYEYSALYGELVTEWLHEKQGTSPAVKPENADAEDDLIKMDVEPQISVEEAKRQEQKQKWEDLAFHEFPTDVESIRQYLTDLFRDEEGHTERAKALKALQENVEAVENEMSQPGQFNVVTLRWVIKGLLASELLTNEKRSVLQDFSASEVILSEVSDVLNMRISSLENWSWDGEVQVEQRRRLNGRYDVFLHEDLLQALLLQYIGVKWSVSLKSSLKQLCVLDGAWKPLSAPVPKKDRKRREYFIGPQTLTPSLRSIRKALHKSIYFCSQLLDTETQSYHDADGVEEAEANYSPAFEELTDEGFAPMFSSAAAPMPVTGSRDALLSRAGAGAACFGRSAMAPPPPGFGAHAYAGEKRRKVAVSLDDTEDVPDHGKPKTPMETKQALLHLLSTEVIINTRFHGEFTCFRSDFDQIGSSLPHSTLFTVLSFIGVSKKWTAFFKTFLQAPLKFLYESEEVEARTQKRGVPKSHVLSSVFIESVLFCLDYSVNQKANGAQLFRTADDFWLWSPSHSTCVRAWETILTFTEVMGLNLNEAKSGAVRIGNKGTKLELDPSLPKGRIRWGMLHLDPINGRFLIDQAMVETHIEELRRQLKDKHSVFAWIQAWNTYASTFFTTNFGTPANCFGRDHVDNILSTFSWIQTSIFQGKSSVVSHLKDLIHARFGIRDIPDGYLFFPTELGGLELASPFISLLQIRDSVTHDFDALLLSVEEAERSQYNRHKKFFEENVESAPPFEDLDFSPADANEFFSFEEYIRYREDFNTPGYPSIRSCFDTLLQKPGEESLIPSTKTTAELERVGRLGMGSKLGGDWYTLTGYWKWVVELYGEDMVQKFGGLNIVDPGQLPIAMVNMFKSGRAKWQG